MARRSENYPDEAQSRRIVELHREFRSTPQIVAEIGCAPHHVRTILIQSGLKPSKSNGGTCYRNVHLLKEWASQGVPLSEMGRRIGSSHSKIHAFLKKHEIPLVPFQQSGENNPAWKGGRTIDKSGYVLVLMPGHPAANVSGYVREHRLVMEQTIGRFLGPTEVVHHKDDDPANNHPDNLELFQSNAEHLAETLKGSQPQWTEDGFRRIQERWSRLGAERRAASQKAS